MRSSWLLAKVCASRLAPSARPAASVIRRERSSKKRLLVCGMKSSHLAPPRPVAPARRRVCGPQRAPGRKGATAKGTRTMRRTGSRGERTRLRPAIRARVLRRARCDNFEETPMRIRAAVLQSDRPSAALCRDAAARRRGARPRAARPRRGPGAQSRRRACAIPTSPSSTAPAPGPCRWRSGTRRRASSRRLARG